MSSENVNIFNDLTHEELVEITVSSLSRILEMDPLLKDVPADSSVEEVMWKIAVEHGKSITVKVMRDHMDPLNVIIPQKGSTVSTLKKSIKHHFEILQKRTKCSSAKVSWKYIWRVYSLEHCGRIMKDNDSLLSNYGIVNRSEIKFVKKRRK